MKYNIGYCESGRYANRIIVPSYSKTGQLNYYTARDFYNYSKLKYLNPKVDKSKIIINELFINWSFPIVLCEGVFDAMAIKLNAIPLLGKYISPLLKSKLIQYNSTIYFALDSDAHIDAITGADELIEEGLNIFIAKLPKGKDPGDLGFEKMQNIISRAKKYDKSDILKELINI